MSARSLPEGLEPLEAAVLQRLVEAHPDQRLALEAQLAVAAIRSRRLTGIGFFLNFSVGAAPLIDPLNCELNDVYASLPGLAHGAGFLLYVRKGRIDFLEGHSLGEEWPGVISEFKLIVRSTHRGTLH